MAGRAGWKWNVVLAAVSVVGVVALSLLLDRALGALAPEPIPEGSMELIFPPGSEQTFKQSSFEYTARTNTLGLREREIQPGRSKQFRIVAIGDSFTYGWGVESEATWLRRLEDNLLGLGYRVETVNCGKPGAGPPFYAELAETVIPILKPDLVVVALLQGNDLSSAGDQAGLPDIDALRNSGATVRDAVRKVYPNIVRLTENRGAMPEAHLAPRAPGAPQKSTAEDNRRFAAQRAQEFLDKMPPEERAHYDKLDDEVRQTFLEGNLNPYMVDLALKAPNFYTQPLNLEDPWIKQCIERVGIRLMQIEAVARRHGAKVVVVSIPHGPYVNDHAWKTIARIGYDLTPEVLESTAPDEAFRQAAEAAGLPFCGVSDAFRAQRSDAGLYFDLDEHFTPKGHQLFAESITPFIEEQIRDRAGRTP